jgi:hypothetical protein
MNTKLLKGVVRLVSEVSVGAVISAVIDKNLPDEMTPVQRTAVSIGSFVLTSVVMSKCGDYMVEMVGAFEMGVESIKNLKS